MPDTPYGIRVPAVFAVFYGHPSTCGLIRGLIWTREMPAIIEIA